MFTVIVLWTIKVEMDHVGIEPRYTDHYEVFIEEDEDYAIEVAKEFYRGLLPQFEEALYTASVTKVIESTDYSYGE